ncbi:MAG: type IV toxin-antitoxin system AbiEi family antitoxin domain-containing protein [Methanosarcinales archaeon]|nr:type IV toxin-antitoxin system AbiEi family antitoxin domain-containing protein [Methanosarcinales archaeon]
MVHRNILLDKLARNGSIFNFQDALNVTSLSRESLKVRLSRMEKKGWIERIEKGKWGCIPFSSKLSAVNHDCHKSIYSSLIFISS